jgi:pimeloyl-ACP methyl ester carboxylesterase
MAAAGALDGWDFHEAGPKNADRTVLLLPGGACSAGFFDTVLAAANHRDPSIRLVAVTLPGFAGVGTRAEASFDNHVRISTELARDLGADVVVGHSHGGNVALEMAATGAFKGPVVLLSPSFSREDEYKVLAVFDRLARIPGMGRLVWSIAIKGLASELKKILPPESQEHLYADMRKNDPLANRALVRSYFAYLDRSGPLVPRLCNSGVPAWVVRGDRDQIGLTDEERRGLEACSTIRMVTVENATHMLLTEQPQAVAEVILEAVAASVTR